MVDVERSSPGEEARDFVPGDLILAHRHHVIARLISLAQKRRFKGPDVGYAHWSHTALVIEADGHLVEAEIRGVVRSPISKYRNGEYHLVRLGADFDAAGRARTVAYAQGQVGRGFGYLDMLGTIVYLMTGWPVRMVRRNHQTCSALVVSALQAGGRLGDLDPALTLPADLARHFEVRP